MPAKLPLALLHWVFDLYKWVLLLPTGCSSITKTWTIFIYVFIYICFAISNSCTKKFEVLVSSWTYDSVSCCFLTSGKNNFVQCYSQIEKTTWTPNPANTELNPSTHRVFPSDICQEQIWDVEVCSLLRLGVWSYSLPWLISHCATQITASTQLDKVWCNCGIPDSLK